MNRTDDPDYTKACWDDKFVTIDDLVKIDEQRLVLLYPKFCSLVSDLAQIKNKFSFNILTVASTVCVGTFLDNLIQNDRRSISRILNDMCQIDRWIDGEPFANVGLGMPMILVDFLCMQIRPADSSDSLKSFVGQMKHNFADNLQHKYNTYNSQLVFRNFSNKCTSRSQPIVDKRPVKIRSLDNTLAKSCKVTAQMIRDNFHNSYKDTDASFWIAFSNFSLAFFFRNLDTVYFSQIEGCLFCDTTEAVTCATHSYHLQNSKKRFASRSNNSDCAKLLFCECEQSNEVSTEKNCAVCVDCFSLFREESFKKKKNIDFKKNNKDLCFGEDIYNYNFGRKITVTEVDEKTAKRKIQDKCLTRPFEEAKYATCREAVEAILPIFFFRKKDFKHIDHVCGYNYDDELDSKEEIQACANDKCKHNDSSCLFFRHMRCKCYPEACVCGKRCLCFNLPNDLQCSVFHCKVCQRLYANHNFSYLRSVGGCHAVFGEMLWLISLFVGFVGGSKEKSTDTLVDRSYDDKRDDMTKTTILCLSNFSVGIFSDTISTKAWHHIARERRLLQLKRGASIFHLKERFRIFDLVAPMYTRTVDLSDELIYLSRIIAKWNINKVFNCCMNCLRIARNEMLLAKKNKTLFIHEHDVFHSNCAKCCVLFFHCKRSEIGPIHSTENPIGKKIPQVVQSSSKMSKGKLVPFTPCDYCIDKPYVKKSIKCTSFYGESDNFFSTDCTECSTRWNSTPYYFGRRLPQSVCVNIHSMVDNDYLISGKGGKEFLCGDRTISYRDFRDLIEINYSTAPVSGIGPPRDISVYCAGIPQKTQCTHDNFFVNLIVKIKKLIFSFLFVKRETENFHHKIHEKPTAYDYFGCNIILKNIIDREVYYSKEDVFLALSSRAYLSLALASGASGTSLITKRWIFSKNLSISLPSQISQYCRTSFNEATNASINCKLSLHAKVDDPHNWSLGKWVRTAEGSSKKRSLKDVDVPSLLFSLDVKTMFDNLKKYYRRLKQANEREKNSQTKNELLKHRSSLFARIIHTDKRMGENFSFESIPTDRKEEYTKVFLEACDEFEKQYCGHVNDVDKDKPKKRPVFYLLLADI